MTEPQTHQAFMEEIGRLEEMAREWISLFPQAAAQGQHWQKVLSQVQAHAAEDTCRLAVVGAVKSGKSTMINALLGQDLLKRGAGILTAMITRVQPGPEPGAVLQFKGWDEINGEIRRALGLLPNPRLVERAEPLNLQGGSRSGTPGPGPGRGPGGRALDRGQPGPELSAAEILSGGLRPPQGPHARHRGTAAGGPGLGPPPGAGHPGGHRGVP